MGIISEEEERKRKEG